MRAPGPLLVPPLPLLPGGALAAILSPPSAAAYWWGGGEHPSLLHGGGALGWAWATVGAVVCVPARCCHSAGARFGRAGKYGNGYEVMGAHRMTSIPMKPGNGWESGVRSGLWNADRSSQDDVGGKVAGGRHWTGTRC